MLINGSEKVSINFNNSEVELCSGNISRTIYWLKVNYDLESEIIIHRDAFNIEYAGKTIEEYYLATEGKIITDKNYKLKEDGFLLLSFQIRKEGKLKRAEPGDTIRITAPDFITYNRETVSLGELILVFEQKVEEKD